MSYLIFGLLRLCMAVMSVTWHVPDETWQSTEIAHGLVFGYGYRTWEWKEAAIRSYLHPLLFVPVLWLLKIAKLDSTYTVVLAPRIFQAFITWIGDIYVLKTISTKRESVKNWFILFYLGNWFINYCGSRTLINTLEMSLNHISLYYYDQSVSSSSSISKFYLFVVMNFAVRPTSAIFWAPMVVFRLWERQRFIWKELSRAVPIALFVMGISVAVDSFFYGRFQVVSFNFFKANVLSGVGHFYGIHSFHWYLSNASLVVLNVALIPVVLGLFSSRKDKALRISLCVYVIVFSCLAHKEYRFVLPVITPFLHFAAEYCSTMSGKSRQFLRCSYLLLNLVAVIYFSTFHQSGTTRVVTSYLPSMVPPNGTVLFLMPCHSTPFYGHLHRPDITLRFLTCEPHGVDEAEEFYADPGSWLDTNGPLSTNHVVVCFDVLVKRIERHLTKFKLCKTIFHTHFPNDRVGGEVLLFC